MFPERGTRRDDLRPGLRVTGFERRVTIAFHVTAEAVIIDRILYGGHDFAPALYATLLRPQPPPPDMDSLPRVCAEVASADYTEIILDPEAVRAFEHAGWQQAAAQYDATL